MRVFGLGDKHIGGLMLKPAVTPGTSPSLWFQVANLEEAMAKAEQLGGRVISGKSPVPRVGHSAQLADPDGNPVGIVEYA
jgi:predicted enzyme related to lactoylglutathione lyase